MTKAGVADMLDSPSPPPQHLPPPAIPASALEPSRRLGPLFLLATAFLLGMLAFALAEIVAALS